MPNNPLRLPFPMGGVSKRFGHSDQPPSTTPSALNVWPAQPSTGRLRGGTRPDLTSLGGSVSGVPYHWCHLRYKGTGTNNQTFVNRRIAVVHAGGTSVTATGSSFGSAIIGTAPASDFCSVAAFQQVLLQASIGTQYIYYYDYVAASGSNLTAAATAGTPPEYAGVICSWGGRVVVAGIKDEPHVVRGSAIGAYLDWDETSTDPDAAFSTTGAGNSAIGEAVVVAFAHNHECLVVGGPDSIYMIRGNPASNSSGSIYLMSRGVGPLMMAAICKGAHPQGGDVTYMMTRMGPAFIPEGCGSAPQMIGIEQIPDELVGVDPGSGDYAACAFDYRWNLLHVYVNRNGGSESYLTFDPKRNAWWPMTFGSTLRLVADMPWLGSNDVASVMAMTSGGAAYSFDASSPSESIASHVDYGPFVMGASPGQEGLLTGFSAVLAEDSDDVTYDAYVGASEQEAANSSTSLHTDSLATLGFNARRHPRLRGYAGRARLSASGSNRLSVEDVLPTIASVSERRVP